MHVSSGIKSRTDGYVIINISVINMLMRNKSNLWMETFNNDCYGVFSWLR